MNEQTNNNNSNNKKQALVSILSSWPISSYHHDVTDIQSWEEMLTVGSCWPVHIAHGASRDDPIYLCKLSREGSRLS